MPEMRQNVTVVPGDGLIAVDGVSLWFAFEAPASLHALQWHDGAGEMEWTDDMNHPLTPADYAEDVAPFVALWEAEKARLEAEADRPPTLEEAKAEACDLLRSRVAASFSGVPDIDVTEAQVFATLDEYGRGGRDIRVRCQLRPGVDA